MISWVLVPPSGSLISIIFIVLLYYSLGTALERAWGTFRYNVYIFSGILFTVIGAFALYFIAGTGMIGYGGLFSTYYINMSIFLAFAVSYPDMELLLYFIIPIKMKWMAIVFTETANAKEKVSKTVTPAYDLFKWGKTSLRSMWQNRIR